MWCSKEAGRRQLTIWTGLQIPAIENLASHQGTYDTLNLTDNSITALGNIPLCKLRSIRYRRREEGSVGVGLEKPSRSDDIEEMRRS